MNNLTLGDLTALKSLILFHDDLNELEENIGVNVEELYDKINNLMLDYKVASGTIRMSYYAVVETDATEPQVPSMYHRDLCNYAIAIANAKSAPDIYNTYWTKWMMNMDNLINEAADRDLIFSVREEI